MVGLRAIKATAIVGGFIYAALWIYEIEQQIVDAVISGLFPGVDLDPSIAWPWDLVIGAISLLLMLSGIGTLFIFLVRHIKL